jgi:hypothetical protein
MGLLRWMMRRLVSPPKPPPPKPEPCYQDPYRCPRALRSGFEILDNAPGRPGMSFRCYSCRRMLP